MGCFGTDERCCPSRWVFAFMGFASVSVAYILRVDVNLALVGMVNHTALNQLAFLADQQWIIDHNGTLPDGYPAGSEASCPWPDDPAVPATVSPTAEAANNTILQIDGPFVWEEYAQTVIISSFYGGYLWSQLFGGRISEHFGGKRVIAFATMTGAILHFLAPAAALAEIRFLILQRFLSGLSLGFVVPTLNVMISKWCPPGERSRMNAAVHSGQLYGTVIALPLTGAILENLGWQAVFYVIGSLAVLHSLAWMHLVHEAPGVHPSISRAERNGIEGAIGKQRHKAKLPLPWKHLITSGPFWAIVLGVIGNAFGFSIVLSLLPTYLSEILHLSVTDNGLVSAVPFLAQACTALPASIAIDWIRRKRLASVTALRKTSHVIGQVGAGAMIMLLPSVGCNRDAVIYILAVSGAVQGFNLSGFSANMLDIAPNFSGTITGIAHVGYNVVSIAAPITAGTILRGRQSLDQWRLIFYASAAFYWAGALAFVALASGEEQPWNRPLIPQFHAEKRYPPDGQEDESMSIAQNERRRTKDREVIGADANSYGSLSALFP